MPRTARKISGANLYHVMLRGINRQNIFEDDEDRRYFMTVLMNCRETSAFRLHAFVLMSNHVHLLMETADEPLDMIFRRIGTRYAVWYNRKYQRAGHLFQDRFRSESIETDQYYMTVLRYILQNPMKAGLESCPGSYKWSSFRAYEMGKGALTYTKYAEDLFGGRENLLAYLVEKNEDTVMDEEDHDWRLRDEQAKEIIRRITGCESASDFQRMEPADQKRYARELYLEKLSMGQISRLTGMSKTTVHRAVQASKDQPYEENLLLKEEQESAYQFDDDLIW